MYISIMPRTLWYSRQSEISGTGCSSCVNRKTARVSWQANRDHGSHNRKTWSDGQSGSYGQQIARGSRGLVAPGGTRLSKDVRPWYEIITWFKKTVNMAVLHQSVSASYVSLSSFTLPEFWTFQKVIKRVIYFRKECVTVLFRRYVFSLCCHITPLLIGS